MAKFIDSLLTSVDYNPLDKQSSINNYVNRMFDATNRMFVYEGLPETIPSDMLELSLQISGHCCITKVDGELYALVGELGGAPDPYYRHTLYVVANPALGYSASLRILNHLPPYGTQADNGNCVLIKNDTNMVGLKYLYFKQASQLTENDITIRSTQINARHQIFIRAKSDREKSAADDYLKGVEDGKISAIFEAPFLDGISADNLSMQNSTTVMQLIELRQYIRASWYNEIGLNSNFNLKREYVSADELDMASEVLFPNIDDMLYCREQALDFINSTYNTNIKVRKNSSWEQKQRSLELEEQRQIALVEQAKNLAGEQKEVDTDETEIK